MSAYTSSGSWRSAAMNNPNATSAAPSAPSGIRSDSPARANRTTSDLADDALDQIVHLLQHHVGLLLRDAGGDHDLAGVVLQGALEDDEVALHHLRLRRVGPLARRLRHRGPVRRGLHETVLQSAAQEVDQRLAGLGVLDVHGVGSEPVPLRAREVAL